MCMRGYFAPAHAIHLEICSPASRPRCSRVPHLPLARSPSVTHCTLAEEKCPVDSFSAARYAYTLTREQQEESETAGDVKKKDGLKKAAVATERSRKRGEADMNDSS